MRDYPIRCSASDCAELAEFKIAAGWSDGTTQELKSYGFACHAHLEQAYRRAAESRARCRLTEGETLQSLGVYRLHYGRRDRELERLCELDERLARQVQNLETGA